MEEIRDYLGKVKKELEEKQLEYKKAKREYDGGKKVGISYAKKGMDMGSQYKGWLEASDYWKQGYKEGWRDER